MRTLFKRFDWIWDKHVVQSKRFDTVVRNLLCLSATYIELTDDVILHSLSIVIDNSHCVGFIVKWKRNWNFVLGLLNLEPKPLPLVPEEVSYIICCFRRGYMRAACEVSKNNKSFRSIV